MIVANCPRCREPFRVPGSELPSDAYAQCPWCSESFPVSDVFEKLPPVLEIMSADGEPLSIPQPVAAIAGVAHEGMGLADEIESDDFGDVSSVETVVEDGTGFDSNLTTDQYDGNIDEIDPYESSESDSSEVVQAESSPEEQDWDEQSWVNDEDDEVGSPVTSAVESTEVGFEFNESDPESVTDPDDTWEGPIEPPETKLEDTLAPMKVSAAPARKKKSGSALRTGLGVVLGGLASVPIAGGILWALGTELPFWPFNTQGESNTTVAAAPLSNSTQQQLETQFPTMGSDEAIETMPPTEDPERAALEQIASETLETTEIAVPSTGMEIPEQNSSGFEPPSIDTKANDSNGFELPQDLKSTDDTELSLPENPSMVASEGSTTKQPSEMTTPKLAEPKITEPKITEPKITEPKTAETESPIPAVESPVATIESPELISAADRASKMVEAMSGYNGPESERERRMLITYQTIAGVCEMATGDGESIRKLADTIKSSSILDRVSTFSSEWLKYSGRQNDGIALIGRPGANSAGQTITLDDGRVVLIAGGTQLPDADKVIGLGRITDDGSTVELVLTETLE